ncbi:MAG: hypothetical protein EOM31_07505 [Bacteroidia bacterium]|nr:hypothetical protein [Bacteroidia bacterium]
MKRGHFYLFLCFLTLGLYGCDDGRIEEKQVDYSEEGRVLKLTGRLSGLDSWGSTYSLVVAGYDGVSDYAVITKALPANHVDGQVLQIVMSGIGEEVKTLKLCAINRLRKSVVDFKILDEDFGVDSKDTIRLDVGTLDVGMYAAIQTRVFDAKCVSCHGQSTFAGAGLYLTAEKSYEALVNKPSVRKADMLLVKPGDVQASFLQLVLHSNGVVRHDHKDLFSEKEANQLDLIDRWIENGALN